MFTERLNIQQTKHPLDDQPTWLNDPRNTQYSEQRHKVHDKKSCAEYISQCSYFWGIQEVDTGDWIGTASAFVDEYNEIADMGILIHWEYSGKGYGAEAWTRICSFLLNERKLRKVEAGTMANNLPFRKLATKCGMFVEGERKNHFLDNNSPVNLIQYGKWP